MSWLSDRLGIHLGNLTVAIRPFRWHFSALFLVIPPSQIVAPALFAHPLPVVQVGVRGVERMPLSAVRFLGIAAGDSTSAHDVCSLLDSFKVRRVHTQRSRTEVVDYQSIWDRANQKFIRGTVYQPTPTYAIYGAEHTGISVRANALRPYPALVVSRDGESVDSIRESNRKGFHTNKNTMFVGNTPEVNNVMAI